MQTIGLVLGFVVVLAAFACAGGASTGSVITPATAQSGIQDRLAEVVKDSAAKSRGGRFWVVYSINARRGIGIDEEMRETKGTVLKDGLRISLRPASESKSVGVFLLYNGSQIEKVEIHDLDRYRTQDEYPAQSLGQVTTAESIALLKSLLAEQAGKLTGERIVLAIGLHDDPQVATTLLSIVKNAGASDKERGAAAMWLGQASGQKNALETLARDEELPVEVRKQAIVGLGFSHYPDVLPILQNFYETFSDRELKQQALFAASLTIDRTAATAFLSKVKNTDPDQDLRQQASLWLKRLSAPSNQ